MAKKKQGISGVAAFLNSARREKQEEEPRFKRQKYSESDSDDEAPEEEPLHAPVRASVVSRDSSESRDEDDSGDDDSGDDSNESHDSSDSDSSDSSDSDDSDDSDTTDTNIHLTSLPPPLEPSDLSPVPEYSSPVSPHTPYWPDYSSLPSSLSNYYNQRHFLFSKFDEGVLLNNAQWYSTTPELVAEQVAQHMWSRFPNADLVVVDAFGGAGGNAIQLAHYYNHVICIDLEEDSITCAKQNAWVYGVSDKIEFFVGDCFDVLKTLDQVDVLFGSPPWGGPGYKSHGGLFDLFEMEPLELREIHAVFKQYTEDICYFLPKNSDLNQISDVCGSITHLLDVNTGKNPFPTLWPLHQKWAKSVQREEMGLEVDVKQREVGDDVNEEELGKGNKGVTATYNYINGRLKGLMVYLGGLA